MMINICFYLENVKLGIFIINLIKMFEKIILMEIYNYHWPKQVNCNNEQENYIIM